jgi:hypothetical protein
MFMRLALCYLQGTDELIQHNLITLGDARLPMLLLKRESTTA